MPLGILLKSLYIGKAPASAWNSGRLYPDGIPSSGLEWFPKLKSS